MAYTLNTSHPLYGNLVELIGVQGGALVSHKTARTFTNAAETSFGSGTYGEHFVALHSGGSTAYGSEFTPAISTDGTAHGVSLFIAFNAITDSAGADATSGNMLIGNSIPTYRIPNFGITSEGKATIGTGFDEHYGVGPTVVMGTGAHSLCQTRIAGAQTSTSAKLYADGVYGQQGGSGINEITTSHTINRLNGTPGYGGVNCNFVWIVVFDKVLSEAETLSLHNSLGANNAFGLVVSGGTNGSASGATLTGTSSLIVGSAIGTAAGTAAGVTLTGVSSLSVGSATGGAGATGSFTSAALENNTGSGPMGAGVSTAWTWYKGAIGAVPTSTTHGTATTSAGGTITASGLPTGAGFLLGKTADGGIFYQEGTIV